MRWNRNVGGARFCGMLCLAPLALVVGLAVPAHPANCKRVVLAGEVNAGQEWKQAFGQGWVFRLVPIVPRNAGYSGWDLVVDRAQPAGFPDALLLATPPYDSINEHEVGTTFGLRAQDAIGWNPRSFHFLSDPAALRKAQKLYFALRSSEDAFRRAQATGQTETSQAQYGARAAVNQSAGNLVELAAHASAGQLRILDARLSPGTADALPYAQNWALQAQKTPHTVVSQAASTPRGKLEWMRFEITLRLPANWQISKPLSASAAPCE